MIPSYFYALLLLLCSSHLDSPTTTSTDNIIPIKLVERQVLDNKVSILLPENFRPMTEVEKERKYPSANRPPLVYTNEEQNINIAFNHMANPAQAAIIPEYLKAFEQQYSQLEMLKATYQKEVKDINGNTCLVFEFLTPAADTDIYNLMVGLPLEDRLLAVSFNCTQRLMADWQSVAQEIVNSIQLNGEGK